MYLDCVPAAYAVEIELGLRMSSDAVASALESLVERGYVREGNGLYVLSIDHT